MLKQAISVIRQSQPFTRRGWLNAGESGDDDIGYSRWVVSNAFCFASNIR